MGRTSAEKMSGRRVHGRKWRESCSRPRKPERRGASKFSRTPGNMIPQRALREAIEPPSQRVGFELPIPDARVELEEPPAECCEFGRGKLGDLALNFFYLTHRRLYSIYQLHGMRVLVRVCAGCTAGETPRSPAVVRLPRGLTGCTAGTLSPAARYAG